MKVSLQSSSISLRIECSKKIKVNSHKRLFRQVYL